MTAKAQMHVVCGIRNCERPDAYWRALREMTCDDRGHIIKTRLTEQLVNEAGDVLAEHELSEAEFTILYPPAD